MLVDGNPSKVRCINIVGLKRNGISAEGIDSLHEAHRLIYRAKIERPARRRDPRIARPPHPRGQEPAGVHRGPAGRQARPGPRKTEDEGVMTTLASRRRRGRPPRPAPRPGPGGDARASSSSASPTPAPSRPAPSPSGSAPAPSTTTATCSARSTPSPSPCPTVLHREVAGAFLERGRRDDGREAPGRARSPRPRSSSRWPATAAPCSRSGTSSGSTPPSRPSTACRSGPSTSPPSGSRPTPSARPTSASSST